MRRGIQQARDNEPPTKVHCQCGETIAILAPDEQITIRSGEKRNVTCDKCGRSITFRVSQ